MLSVGSSFGRGFDSRRLHQITHLLCVSYGAFRMRVPLAYRSCTIYGAYLANLRFQSSASYGTLYTCNRVSYIELLCGCAENNEISWWPSINASIQYCLHRFQKGMV